MHTENAQSILKMRLGGKIIDPNRVISIERVGSRVCNIKFVTGESITVTCGVEVPDPMRISFPGTPEQLESLLSVYIYANRRGCLSQERLTHTRMFKLRMRSFFFTNEHGDNANNNAHGSVGCSP